MRRHHQWVRRLAVLTLALAAWLAPTLAHAALVKSVTTGSLILPASSTPSNIALTGVTIANAFVICSTETINTNPSTMLASCDLNNNGTGGAAQLTITPAATPGGTTLLVQYYVVEFSAGVSVQRGTATFSGTSLTPSAAASLSAVDCTKSFVLTSTRSTSTSTNADEQWLVRAILGTGASPCTSGTTTSLELLRNEGANGTTVTVAWQVVTLEGASVQRGTSCIGGAGATPACPTASGATNGLNNRVTLSTAVDTTKSFILLTRKGGTAVSGVEGEYNVRGEFLSTGASVTGVQFARSLTVTNNNHQVEIAYEVVSLSDGSTVQTSGTTPLTLASGSTSGTANLTTIDTTRTAVFASISGGDSGQNQRTPDTAVVVSMNGANGAGASSLSFARGSSNIGSVSTAWFAVSFFRCTTPSGVSYDTLCTLGASTTGSTAKVNWSSVNTVLILKSTAAIVATPVNGTSYVAGNTISGVSVVYSGSTASDTVFADNGPLTTGTTYHYKVWAKAGATGGCTASPCYVQGTEATITPRVGNTTWSSIVVGGAALNPAVAGIGTSRMSFPSNAGKLISLSSSTGAWASVPGNTVGATQGYLSVYPQGGGEAVVGADQKGWAYSIDPSTGTYDWIVKLNADAIQAPVSTYLRAYFSSAMTTAYPGSYDIVFVATYNNTGSGGFTNNKVYALRSDTGATLWTFSPSTLTSGLCPSGCPMDQITGQPWVDYAHDRLYIASRDGNLGNQNGLWFLDLTTSGTLTKVFAGADYTTAPSQSFDGNTLYIGDEAGKLHIVNLSTLTETTNLIASGTAFKGFVWEDFGTTGRLYFVTTDGNVWCLPTPSSSSTCWKVKPVSSGTVSQLVESDVRLWVGGSDGSLYQLNLTSGTIEKTFVVGAGSLTLGPVSTETGDQLYAATSDGTLYKISLSSGSLP